MQTPQLFPLRLVARTAMLVACIGLLAGCSYTRSTTTDRTAIEQALMSRTIIPSVHAVQPDAHAERTFHINAEELVSVDKPLIINGLREQLLESGLKAASADSADLIFYPRANFTGIDDSDFLIGLPSFAIVLPVSGGQAVKTPELALIKRSAQQGRSEVAVYAVDRETGQLAFNTVPSWQEKGYTRWTVLIFFNFRTTNLGKPF